MTRTFPAREFLKTIRTQRRNHGFSQSKLGSIVKMPQSQLARIETGASDVRLSTLTEIARALDLEPMLIPKHLVPAVQYMIDVPNQSSESTPRLVGNAPEDIEKDTPEIWER
jgi:HTH-type transcriptional regulator / antitoxin HipB